MSHGGRHQEEEEDPRLGDDEPGPPRSHEDLPRVERDRDRGAPDRRGRNRSRGAQGGAPGRCRGRGPAPELLRAPRARGRDRTAGRRVGGAPDRLGRPGVPGRPQVPRRVRGGDRGWGRAVPGVARGVRGAASRLHGDHREAPSQTPRAHHRGSRRLRRAPRVRDDAPDARAAHPPREGDLEHLHERRTRGARGHGLPLPPWEGRPPRAGHAARVEGPLCRRRPRWRPRGLAQVCAAVLPRVRGRASGGRVVGEVRALEDRDLAGPQVQLLLRRHGQLPARDGLRAAHEGRHRFARLGSRGDTLDGGQS